MVWPQSKVRGIGGMGDGAQVGQAAGLPFFQRAVVSTRREICCSHSWPRLQRHHTISPALAEIVSGVTLTGLRVGCHCAATVGNRAARLDCGAVPDR